MTSMQIKNGLIEDLGSIMGAEATLRLIAIYGGGTLYVPMHVEAEAHPIARLVGAIAFRNLQREFGGETITLPVCEEFHRLGRVRQVARAFRLGLRTGEISALLGISQRQVANYRRQAEELALIQEVFSGLPARDHEGGAELPVVACSDFPG